MQLIDKNGKIFGKVNILDFAVLLLVLLVVFIVAINKFFPDRVPGVIRRMPQQKEFIVKVILDKERNWLADYIKTGDGQRDLENNFMAEIIKVKKAKIADNTYSVIITLRLKANIEPGGFIVYGSNLLRPGENFVLETKGYLLKGLVYSVEESAD